MRNSALRAIAATQAKAGDIAEALRTAGKIDNAHLRTEILRDIAVTQAKAGDIAEALQTVEKIDRGSVATRAGALRDIAAAQAEDGDIAEALRTVEKIDQVLVGIRNRALRDLAAAHLLETRARALRDIAATQAKAGDIAEALRTVEKIDRLYVPTRNRALRDIAAAHLLETRARALSAIATAQAEAGDIVEALQTAEKIDEASKRAVLLSAIAAALAKTEIAVPHGRDDAGRRIPPDAARERRRRTPFGAAPRRARRLRRARSAG